MSTTSKHAQTRIVKAVCIRSCGNSHVGYCAERGRKDAQPCSLPWNCPAAPEVVVGCLNPLGTDSANPGHQ